MQLKVLEGEGVVYRTGTRATRGLTVLVTDETGKPVEMATVSFRLPDEGASGTFSSGLRTEIATTGPDGRATVWGMQWNKTPGPVEIRITAIKDQARAGLVSTQYLSDSVAPKAGGEGVFSASHGGHKWLWLGAIAAGAVGAGAAFGFSKGSNAGSHHFGCAWAFHRHPQHHSGTSIMTRFLSITAISIATLAAQSIHPPRMGFAATAGGALRPIYGVAGNFLLGPPLRPRFFRKPFPDRSGF